MWHDNETTTDLLGFQRFSEVIAGLALDLRVLPVTIGLFGDWGSGKSSVLGMVESKLRTEEGVLALRFDGWLFEGYDDAKAALMTSIIDSLQDYVSENTAIREKVAQNVKGLLRRIDWFRAAGLAAKGILSLTSPIGAVHVATETLVKGISTLAQTIQDPDKLQDSLKDLLLKQPSTTKDFHESISAFRSEFRSLLANAKIRTLVVLIDDLDRCLPDSVVSTLEAIKLFLSVPGTAFVVAADKRVVRHAVAQRYPHKEDMEVDLPQEYLDKLIQIPLELPKLNEVETEIYTYLLFAEHGLDESDFKTLLGAVDKNRAQAIGSPPLNFGILKECLGLEKAKVLETDFGIAAAVAPVLVHNGHGNPRLVKRFLNALALRKQIAFAQKMDLNEAILAKLLVLERFYDDQFLELYTWQNQQGGIPEKIAALEAAVLDENVAVGEEHPMWLTDLALKVWLQTEPRLEGVNLSPYFSLARESVKLTVTGARRLSGGQQNLFSLLQSAARVQRQQGIRLAASMSLDDLYPVYDTLWVKVKANPRGPALDGIIELANLHEAIARRLIKGLSTIGSGALPSSVAPRLAKVAQQHPSLEATVISQLKEWSESSNRGLARAASLCIRQG